MTTNEEIVSGIRQLLAEQGIINDHSDWSERLILFYAFKARSTILKSKLDDPRSRVSHFNKQTLSCIPMDKIDVNECPCAPPAGCYFTKSRYPIPAPLSRYLQVDNIIGNKDIDYIEWGDFRNKLRSRYKREREDPAWTIRNLGDNQVYLYIYNFTEKFATITSIFEQPMEVFLYPDCEGVIKDKCKPHLEFPFVMDDAFIPLVLETAFKMLVHRSKQEDKVINQNDDTSNARIPIK